MLDACDIRNGNIPAYAGKTIATRLYKIVYEGTSPRMRGKLTAHASAVIPLRNIPAYAGKTQR